MIYISGSWSPGMFNRMMNNHHFAEFRNLTQEEFDEVKNHAYSCVNKPHIAKILGIDYNPEHVKLSDGDSLIMVHFKGGKILPEMTELPENVIAEYYCYKVYNPSTHVISEVEA